MQRIYVKLQLSQKFIVTVTLKSYFSLLSQANKSTFWAFAAWFYLLQHKLWTNLLVLLFQAIFFHSVLVTLQTEVYYEYGFQF